MSRTFHDAGAAADHRPVVALGAGHHLARSARPRSGRRRPAAIWERACASSRDDLGPRTGGHEPAGQRVLLRVLAVRLEAAVGVPRRRQLCRVVRGRVVDDRLHRLPQAVDVQPVEADPGCGGRSRFQARSQRQNGRPRRWPTSRSASGGSSCSEVVGSGRVRGARDGAVDPVAVGPVALHRDEREAVLGDQPAGRLLAQPVVLVRAVARLAEQHHPARHRCAPATGRSRRALPAARPASRLTLGRDDLLRGPTRRTS